MFLNDLWAFDLNSRTLFHFHYLHYHLKFLSHHVCSLPVRTRAVWKPIDSAEGSPRPAQRARHICLAYGEKIIMYVGLAALVHLTY